MAKNLKSELWQGDKDPIQILAESNSKLASSMASVEAYAAIVQEIGNGLKEISANSKALKDAFSGSTGSKLGDQVKVNEAHKEAIRLFKAEQEATKALKDAKDALARAEAAELRAITQNEKLYDNLIKQIDKRAQKEAAAAAKREAQYNKEIAQVEKQNTLYNRIQQKLNGLVESYKGLAIRKELGLKLTDQENKRYEFLQQKIGKYDGALKRADASMGKFGRNVGNYSSAFNGLGNSVQQLTREFPAFAVNAQTGILALSNNLPIFFDEIKKIREQNKLLAADGQKTTSAFKQIAQSIFSVTGILSLAVTAFTILGPKLIDWITGNEDAEKAAKKLAEAEKYKNEQINKAAQFIGQESAEYVGYILQLKRTNSGSKERSNLISEINKKYGLTLKNIKDETSFQKMLNLEISNYIKYSKARYEVQKNQDLINRNLQGQEKTQRELNKYLKENAELFGKIKFENIEQLDKFAGSEKVQQNYRKYGVALGEIRKFLEELGRADSRLQNYGFNLLEANSLIDDLGYETSQTTKETEKLNSALQEFDDALERRLSLGERERKLRQEMLQIMQDDRADIVGDIAKREFEAQLRDVEKSGQIFVDTLEMLLNEEFQLRKEAAIQRAEFEKSEAIRRLDETLALEAERLEKERDELLKQEGLTADGRAKINASYQERLRELNTRMLDEERIVALEREKIELELQKELGNIDKERLDRLKEVNDELIEAQIEYSDKVNKEAEEKRKKDLESEKKYRDELKKMLDKSFDEAIKLAEKISKFKEDKFNDEMNQSKALEDQIIAQSQAGIDTDEQSLAAQKKVTAEKLKLKQAEQKEQEVLAKIKAGYEIFQTLLSQGKSVGEATTGTASGLTVIDRVIRLFSKAKAFFDGAEDTGTGGGLDGRGGFAAVLHPHERVVPKVINDQLKGIPNDHLPDAIKAYDLFRVNGMIMQKEIERPIVKQDVALSPIIGGYFKSLEKVIESNFDKMPKELFSVEMRGAILHAFHEQRKANETKRTYLKT